MNNTQAIPKEIALKLCKEIFDANKGKWYSWAALQCRGCVKWSRGDRDMFYFNSSPGYRGCPKINSRYAKMSKNAS